ncbi:MAG: hypothetical protein HOP20_06290 [Sulfuriferula sp.]|nr:hypothetical protein [Sulfuriferula sp.]
MRQKLFAIIGLDFTPVSHTERWIAITGAFFGILSVFLISDYFLQAHIALIMVASMGASAVLLFAVPHGGLSQPWAVFGGHVISAIAGVSCAKLVTITWLAAPLAVAVAVGAMHYLRCIHPPGGATALVAVMGGEKLHALGYLFILEPVIINVTIILLTAIAFSWFNPSRRYPVYFAIDKMEKPSEVITPYPAISHADFVYALAQIDSYIDVNEHDLMRIYQLAIKHHKSSSESVQ